MSGPLSAPSTTIDSLLAQARVQRARGEWRTALQELPPIRRFPPPEKPRHDAQQQFDAQQSRRDTAKRPGAGTATGLASIAYQRPPASMGPLGQQLDLFA